MSHLALPEGPQKPSYRSRLTFFTGLLAGAGLSTMVPWEVLESFAPGARLACLALLAASFVIFRLLFAAKAVRRATAIVMVSAGGLLMSAGAKVLPGDWAISPVGIGAVSFLCGIALLMRERLVPSEVREETINRLLEGDLVVDQRDQPSDDLGQLGKAVERLDSLKLLDQPAPDKAPAKTRVGR